jgi:hypothetical protein
MRTTRIPNNHFVLFQHGENPMFSYNQLRKLANGENNILTPNPEGDDTYLVMTWDDWWQAGCPRISQIM